MSSNSRKGTGIRSFPMKLNEKYVETLIEKLKKSMLHLLKTNKLNENFEDLRKNAATIVDHKHGEKLYNGLKDVLLQHLNSVREDLQFDSKFLPTLNKLWADYQNAVRVLCDILMKLDRVFVPQKGVESTKNLAKRIFMEEIVRHGEIENYLSRTLVDFVMRDDSYITLVEAGNSLEMLKELGIGDISPYTEIFEQPLFQKVNDTFHACEMEIEQFLENADVPKFLHSVQTMKETMQSMRQKLELVDQTILTKFLETFNADKYAEIVKNHVHTARAGAD